MDGAPGRAALAPAGKRGLRAPPPNDGFATPTSAEQEKQEAQMKQHFAVYSSIPGSPSKVRLLREAHIQFCLNGLETMPAGMAYLDSSRPWLCYWILHSLELLGWRLSDQEQDPQFQETHSLRTSHVVDWISRCFHEETDEKGNTYGGYGGSPGQWPHLAPTYAAICTLCIIGTEQAYSSIPRDQLLRWMLRLKTPEHSFQMHENGEVDIRAIYTSMAVACLLNILTPELTDGVADYLLRCQTFEGGIGCEPFDEAHGGYTFCGLAALMILKQAHRLNLPALLRWITARQKRLEGGFDGRTNKLVDSCYSFWVGATYPLVAALFASMKTNLEPDDVAALDYVQLLSIGEVITPEFAQETSKESKTAYVEDAGFIDTDIDELLVAEGEWFFDEVALQEYLMICCQNLNGGLRDKPEKCPDFYHTCYALSGLAIAQNMQYDCHIPGFAAYFRDIGRTQPTVLGDKYNALECNNPLINVSKARLLDALKYFGNRTHI